MDGNALSISPSDLYARIGTAKAPLLIDVRRAPAFEADDTLIIGSARRLPDDVASWRNAIPANRSVVAYCVHGHEVSQGVASALQKSGVQAAYLEGGIAGWKERKLPTRRKRGTAENKWVTREHPKIDLITRRPVDADWLEAELARLEQLVEDGETLELVGELRRVVAEPRRDPATAPQTDPATF